jgi:thiol-disulfide isomerase/thioredoxin
LCCPLWLIKLLFNNEEKILTLMKNLLVLFCLVSTLAHGQGKKKTVYLDTLGNTIELMEFISIRNTGRYNWYIDESDEKISLVKWKPTTKKEYDSLKEKTYNKSVLAEKIGKKFNYQDFVDINGVSYSADKLKDKVVVINYWFVGCGPCKVEMPELNQLVDKYRNNNEVIFISFAKSSKPKITKFLEKNPFGYAVIVMTTDLAKEFKISAFPTNYVIDKNGTYHHASRGIGIAAVDILADKIESALTK